MNQNPAFKDPLTVEIEAAYDQVSAQDEVDIRTFNALRVGRIAARRRDAGLSWNQASFQSAQTIARELVAA